MKTKVIIIISIISISLYFLFKNKSTTGKDVSGQTNKTRVTPAGSPQKNEFKAAPQVKDLEVLAKSISKEVSKTTFWESTIDFSLSERQILKKIDPMKVYIHSKNVISNLSKCVAEHCGLRPDEDGFFDPANTTADKLLARNLKLLNLVHDETTIFDFNLEGIEFDDIFSSKNSDVQLNGLILFLKTKDSPEDIQYLFKRASLFDDTVKGQFFSQMDDVTKQSPELRNTYVGTITNMLNNENGNSVVEISENLGNLNLDIEELQVIIKGSCNQDSERIQNVLRVNFNEYLSKKNLNLTYEEACN